ncbi:MAG: winged helix-turn-helix transcriptional regulator [Actinobacteria bacterium]|nr:winged helix-turn-helix transcriptional regulator [Actinomycetota bacterium]
MLRALFRSRVTIRLLGYFMKYPERETYLREVSREISEPASAVRRELERLETFGLIRSRSIGNHKYFSVREDFPVLPELKDLFLKTEGAVDYLKESFSRLEEVQLAFLHGDFAERPSAASLEIDIVVVGTIGGDQLRSLIEKLQSILARKINYTLYESKEFGRLLEEEDPSLRKKLDGEKIVLAANLTNKG